MMTGSSSHMATEATFNPVLLEIPDHIQTERLLLRAPRPGDGATVNASVIETLEDLRRYPASMLWAMEEQQREVVRSERAKERGLRGGLEGNESTSSLGDLKL